MEERKLAAMEATLRSLEARTDANHESIGRLRASTAQHETAIAVMQTELRETREDIAEIKKEVVWVRRGLWAAAGTFLIFFLGVVQLLLSGGGA